MNDVNQPRGTTAAARQDGAPASANAARLTDLVERWWDDHFPGSPVAQVTAAWNHAFAAKEALKRRLNDLKSGE